MVRRPNTLAADHMVKSALQLARVTSEDPYAGIPEPGQLGAISGDLDTPFGACTSDMLERAKRHIEERFSFVGITERFDESLVLLRRTFAWKPPYYVAANVTP